MEIYKYKNYNILFPFSFDEINIVDDNIDVCVKYPDKSEHTFVFATKKNAKKYPDVEMIIVGKLTRDRILHKLKKILK